jgi:hypothetical protein
MRIVCTVLPLGLTVVPRRRLLRYGPTCSQYVHFGPHDGLREMCGASIYASGYDRLDGNIPEDRGAHFGDRNLYFGGAYSWLASQIVDSD